MNYKDPHLISLLSAEYVLGTLRGQARQRFKRLLLTRPDVRDSVLYWEEYFAALNTHETPSEVPDVIWQRINDRLFETKEQTTPFWKKWALLTTMATALLSMLLIFNFPDTQGPENLQTYVSIFQDENKGAVWSVSVRPEQKNIVVTPINVPELAANKSYELWLLPKGGQPISLGLLSENQSEQLAFENLDFAGGVNLAVSLEPEGGSPTGQPTGEILYVAEVHPAG
ncbi:MAG: anti-sigma factor [Arenicella sp.]